MRDDWRAWLPEPKSRLNDQFSKELDTLYCIFSVSLDEALELRRAGSVAQAYEAVRISRGVCARFSQSLEVLLACLHRHAKHFGVVPNAAPLDPENFRGSRGQRTAKITSFLNRILLSQRSQFIHKAATLRDLVSDLGEEFCKATDELVGGVHLEGAAFWETLDRTHFDLNTCLREAIVLLKSFLLAMPDEQLLAFETAVTFRSARTSEPALAFRHRRFAAVPGK